MDQRTINSMWLVFNLFFFSQNGVEGYNLFSKEEDLKLEEELKHLNKPSVKTIHTKYGDIYDCVDFYQQPSFDHPLLKNHKFHPGMKPSIVFERLTSNEKVVNTEYKSMSLGLEDGGCPFGTVPIKRNTKDDLISVKLYRKSRINSAEPLGTHHAIARTKTHGPYRGAITDLNIYNLPVIASQSTSGQLKLTNGDESIITGWTVNPGVYGGDNRTRMFVYVDAKMNCFNTQCGFVQVNKELPVNKVMEPSSTYGGEQWFETFLIHQDPIDKNWYLATCPNLTYIGFWPKSIFAKMGEGATGVEWGGESYSPPGVPAPGMGSGHIPIKNSMYDGFACRIQVLLKDTLVDPGPLETYTDNKDYHFAIDVGDVHDPNYGHVVSYGGHSGLIVKP